MGSCDRAEAKVQFQFLINSARLGFELCFRPQPNIGTKSPTTGQFRQRTVFLLIPKPSTGALRNRTVLAEWRRTLLPKPSRSAQIARRLQEATRAPRPRKDETRAKILLGGFLIAQTARMPSLRTRLVPALGAFLSRGEPRHRRVRAIPHPDTDTGRTRGGQGSRGCVRAAFEAQE